MSNYTVLILYLLIYIPIHCVTSEEAAVKHLGSEFVTIIVVERCDSTRCESSRYDRRRRRRCRWRSTSCRQVAPPVCGVSRSTVGRACCSCWSWYAEATVCQRYTTSSDDSTSCSTPSVSFSRPATTPSHISRYGERFLFGI